MKTTKKDTNKKRRFCKYYAVEWNCGRAVCANTGGRYGASYFSFFSEAARDEWADGGGEFTSSEGWRDALPASDPELRMFILKKDVWSFVQMPILKKQQNQ